MSICLAKIGFDTAEEEPSEIREICSWYLEFR